MKPYPAYKDSGVAWLGQMPAHWDIEKLKWLANVSLSNVDKKTKEDEPEIELCNYLDVYYNEVITRSIDFMRASASKDQIRRLSLESGDVLITKDSETPDDIAVPAYVPETLPGVVCGYHLAHIRPYPTKLDGNYLFHSFLANGIKDQFEFSANGITRFGISKYTIENALFVVPPLPEQTAIAAFLDRKTAQIDAIIAKKERLIELLREERTAMISKAVTKGLNPHVPVQDSGIPWLGQVPAHWEIVPLKFASPSITVGIVVTPAKYYKNNGVPCLRSLNIRAGEIVDKDLVYISSERNKLMRKSMIYEGDIVSVRTGKPGTSAVVNERFHEANCIDLIIIRRSTRFVSEFLVYFLNSDHAKLQFEAHSDGAIQQHFNIDTAKNMWIPLPPNDEQKVITDFIDQKTSQIDGTVAQNEKQITLLQEYRTALISAVVTGKVDVREETVP